MSETPEAMIEIDTVAADTLLAKLPADVRAQYRAEALRRRVPVRVVMQEALVAVASEFGRPPAAPQMAA